jgi:Ser/Thr protein kinase RdoA (MazF antagonist)
MAALQRTLGDPAVAVLRRQVSAYSTSCTIEEVEAQLSDGTVLKLALKDLGWEALLGTAARVRPRFMYQPAREIAVYQCLLARAELGTTRVYGSLADERTSRYWLLLEWVDGARLCHVGELAAWQAAAAWLRRLHAIPIQAAVSLPLVRCDRGYYQTWIDRALERNRQSPLLQRLHDTYASVVDRLLALPQAIIHGEYYASNVLVQQRTGGYRICPIDWETAGVGPALMDLAALTSGQWAERERLAMVRAYGGDEVTPEMLEGLDVCRLHQTIQWLGWPDDRWDAPADQARDWLAEAEQLAAILDL